MTENVTLEFPNLKAHTLIDRALERHRAIYDLANLGYMIKPEDFKEEHNHILKLMLKEAEALFDEMISRHEYESLDKRGALFSDRLKERGISPVFGVFDTESGAPEIQEYIDETHNNWRQAQHRKKHAEEYLPRLPSRPNNTPPTNE